MAIKNIFKGALVVERGFDAGAPQSLMDSMTAFATLKKAAEDAGFAVDAKSSTSKKREPEEQA
jgi:hypothetical protein